MRLYYVCECCDQIYRQVETEGEGLAEVPGLCDECAREVGTKEPGLFLTNRPFYH